MSLPHTAQPRLQEGALGFISQDKVNDSYLSTSGCVGYQFPEAQHIPGRGPIPNCDLVRLVAYQVSTKRLYLPHVRGIEGSFYAISPSSIRINGIPRGDFGIHFDANVPGSAGCIVIRNPSDWERFKKEMSDLNEKGIQQIDLLVKYA